MMTLHGADVFIRIPNLPELPNEIGPFSLLFISDRGTRVTKESAVGLELSDWPRARYFSETEASQEQVDELVNAITSLGFEWTKIQKLFKIDGANAFSQPY